jgi:hypothetical protein
MGHGVPRESKRFRRASALVYHASSRLSYPPDGAFKHPLTDQLLAILLIEVIVTLVNYGGSLSTWKTPFNELLVGSGGSLRGARGTKESGVGAPAMQQAQAPAPVTSAV